MPNANPSDENSWPIALPVRGTEGQNKSGGISPFFLHKILWKLDEFNSQIVEA